MGTNAETLLDSAPSGWPVGKVRKPSTLLFGPFEPAAGWWSCNLHQRDAMCRSIALTLSHIIHVVSAFPADLSAVTPQCRHAAQWCSVSSHGQRHSCSMGVSRPASYTTSGCAWELCFGSGETHPAYGRATLHSAPGDTSSACMSMSRSMSMYASQHCGR